MLLQRFLFSVDIFCDVISGTLDVTSNAGNGHRGQDGGAGERAASRSDAVRCIPHFLHILLEFKSKQNGDEGWRVEDSSHSRSSLISTKLLPTLGDSLFLLRFYLKPMETQTFLFFL